MKVGGAKLQFLFSSPLVAAAVEFSLGMRGKKRYGEVFLIRGIDHGGAPSGGVRGPSRSGGCGFTGTSC